MGGDSVTTSIATLACINNLYKQPLLSRGYRQLQASATVMNPNKIISLAIFSRTAFSPGEINELNRTVWIG
jgi:hypothetical protein